MKKSDLFREYARCVDMCEGTMISPKACFKYDNRIYGLAWTGHPSFELEPEKYEFALAIVENMPVWEGNCLYSKTSGQSYFAQSNCRNFEDLTWSLPKPKTVKIELLREDAEDIARYYGLDRIKQIFIKALEQ